MEEVATRAGIPYKTHPISEHELRGANEVWLSASTREVQAVTQLDGRSVGTGKPGPLWRRIYEEWQRYKQALANQPW